jgi:hypothetical protein
MSHGLQYSSRFSRSTTSGSSAEDAAASVGTTTEDSATGLQRGSTAPREHDAPACLSSALKPLERSAPVATFKSRGAKGRMVNSCGVQPVKIGCRIDRGQLKMPLLAKTDLQIEGARRSLTTHLPR